MDNLIDIMEFGDDDEINPSEYLKMINDVQKSTKYNDKVLDARYSVQHVPITPEILERRKIYEDDYVLAHTDLFPRSTGMKPFGPDQIDSIKKSHHVLTHGGRLVSAEPRGFVKTGRATNHSLLAALQGKRKYIVILCESVEKGNEILDSIKTELTTNEKIEELYPSVVACFDHLEGKPHRGPRQTMNGQFTGISIKDNRIRFPVIEGEPCSGSIIQVKSWDKVRGLATRIKKGKERGVIIRPDFVFLDDIQSDEDAVNPNTVLKIIKRLKKTLMFAGGHHKRISAIMCCTPIEDGDVSCHYILDEPGWQVSQYSMLRSPPKHMDMWYGEYATRLLSYDKYELGSQTKAALYAREYFEANKEKMLDGAEWAWDWCFGWDEDPQSEIHPVQHAMNFLITEGEEAFNSECQVIVRRAKSDSDDIMASEVQIVEKQHPYHRYICPIETQHMTCHIDVNGDILTYAVGTSGKSLMPHIIDYGTFPEQPSDVWEKGNLRRPLSLDDRYKEYPELEVRLYLAIKDCIDFIMNKEYWRDDEILWKPELILVDCSWEYHTVLRALRDSQHKAIVRGGRGKGYNEKTVLMESQKFSNRIIKSKHSFTAPVDTGQLVTNMDVNTLKTLVHRGFRARYGVPGSVSMFLEQNSGQHNLPARHCNAETPTKMYNEKEDRHVVVWKEDPRLNNEYFDNFVGVLGGLFYVGCDVGKKQSAPIDMQKWVEDQSGDND